MSDLEAPSRGDIIWVNFSPQAGREQAKRCPALVLSPLAYNAKVGLCIACPITSRAKGYPFEVEMPEGLNARGVILSDHIKSLDWRARRAEIAGSAPAQIVDDVLAKLSVLLSPV